MMSTPTQTQRSIGGGWCRLRVLGEGPGRRVWAFLGPRSIRLGADATCDWTLEGASVAPAHAIVEWDGQTLSIAPLVDDVCVNGRPIDGVTRLSSGDQVELGGAALIAEGSEVPTDTSVRAAEARQVIGSRDITQVDERPQADTRRVRTPLPPAFEEAHRASPPPPAPGETSKEMRHCGPSLPIHALSQAGTPLAAQTLIGSPLLRAPKLPQEPLTPQPQAPSSAAPAAPSSDHTIIGHAMLSIGAPPAPEPSDEAPAVRSRAPRPVSPRQTLDVYATTFRDDGQLGQSIVRRARRGSGELELEGAAPAASTDPITDRITRPDPPPEPQRAVRRPAPVAAAAASPAAAGDGGLAATVLRERPEGLERELKKQRLREKARTSMLVMMAAVAVGFALWGSTEGVPEARGAAPAPEQQPAAAAQAPAAGPEPVAIAAAEPEPEPEPAAAAIAVAEPEREAEATTAIATTPVQDELPEAEALHEPAVAGPPPNPGAKAAVDHLIAGQYRKAMQAYDGLAQLAPQRREYAAIAEILERKIAERCAEDPMGDESCQPVR